MLISRATARSIVPWGRIVFGTLCVAAPNLGLRAFLINPDANADGRLLIRVFGSRAFVIGALSAGIAGPEAARRAILAAAFMDAVDVSSMARAQREGRMSATALAYNAVIGFYASNDD